MQKLKLCNYIRLYSDKESKYFSDTGKELIPRDAFPNNKLYAKKLMENGDLQIEVEI